jgi:broad specificity phosphatase PhoE
MKNQLLLFIFAILSICEIQAQKTTYYLVRHAEKDTSLAVASMMQSSPPLSDKGIQRANRLASILEKEQIDYIFSTNYLRTTSTAKPLATMKGQSILLYDPNKAKAFSDSIQNAPFIGKTILIVGHSNTIPPLVNTLIKTNKYPNLNDNEYGFIYKIIIGDGQVKDTVLSY